MKVFCELDQDNRVIGGYLEGHPAIPAGAVEITEDQHKEVMELQGRAGIVDNIVVDIGEPPPNPKTPEELVEDVAREEIASDTLLEQLKNITPNQAHNYVMNPDNDLRVIVAALAKYIAWRHN